MRFLLIAMLFGCGRQSCPDSIAACQRACGEGRMVSYDPDHGCQCAAPTGGKET